MIPDDDAEKATEYLRDRAALIGQLRGRVKFAEGNLRRVKALQMMETEGGLGERETRAYASEQYLDALNELREAEAEYETERAYREAAQYRIEVWRSQTSARKQGY